MARTQAADYELRRADIVEKAAGLYAAKGFRGASVSDVAEACGISKSLVYHYFPSTRDILFSVMSSHVEDLLAAVETAGARNAAPRVKLKALLRDFLALYAGAADRQTVLLNELDQLDPEARAKIVGAQRLVIDKVEAILGEVRPDLSTSDKHRVVTMLFFGMINWLHTWYDPEQPIKPDAVADLAAALFLDGLERAPL
jgi:AcrR family transcriptional regulator